MKKRQNRSSAVTRAQALTAGSPRYFTGKPCPRGHVAERLTCNCTCIDCLNGKQRERRAAGLMAEKDKARYWKDPNGNRAKSKAQYQKHLEKRRAYDRERSLDPERHASIVKRSGEYAKRNRAKITALTAKYRARKRHAMPPWLTAEMVVEIRAFYAAAKKSHQSVDHIIPIAGKTVCGLHVPWNLQVLPLPENQRKGNRYAEAP